MHDAMVLHLHPSHAPPRDEVLGVCVDADVIVDALEVGLDLHTLVEVGRREDHFDGGHVQTENRVHLTLDLFEDALHDEGVAHVVGLDDHLVLVDVEVLAEAELELVREQGRLSEASPSAWGC